MWTFIFIEIDTRQFKQLMHEEMDGRKKKWLGIGILIWNNAITIDLIILFESH